MAMVKLSGEITEINGKSGGNVWRTDVCGQHIQKIPRRVWKPPTQKQRIRRKWFRWLWVYWRNYLSQWSRDIWNDYGKAHGKHNKKGELIWWSGFHHFVSINLNLIIESGAEAVRDLPPL